MRMRLWVVVVCAMCLRADIASGQITGPVLGYAKRGADLRVVLGVPGAAYFGATARPWRDWNWPRFHRKKVTPSRLRPIVKECA